MRNFMVFRSSLVNFCVLLILGVSLSSGQNSTSKNVICHYPYNGEETPGVTTYNTSDIDISICTHLLYDNTRADAVSYTVLEELQALKISNPSLKVIIQVDDRENNFPGTLSHYHQLLFLFPNLIDFMRTWNFDGISWTWYDEPITQELLEFIEEMRYAFLDDAYVNQLEPLILMFSALGWGPINVTDPDLFRLGKAVDIFHARPVGYNPGDLDLNMTAFVSPMYGNGGLYGNVSQSVTDFLEAGIPPQKLHIGIKLAATTYRLLDLGKTGIGAPADRDAQPGEYTQRTDQLAYYEVCKLLQEGNYTVQVDAEGLVNFAYKDDQWMTYEDPASLRIKMNYVEDNNLGGVVVMYLYDDDYTGQFCNQGTYPLISTLYGLELPTTLPPTTTTPPPKCPNGFDKFPDPYSCQHYRVCVYDMLFRDECDTGLSYDADQKVCVQNSTTPCVTVPQPDTTQSP